MSGGPPLAADLAELVEAAQRLIGRRFTEDRHHVAAALRTTGGRVFAAVNVEATVGRADVCAEGVAIGMAASEDALVIDAIVAVDRVGNVLSPCGGCRDLISDYSPGARVVVPGEGGPEVTAVLDLLPNKYRSRWRDS